MDSDPFIDANSRRPAFLVSQHEGIIPFHDLSREDEIGSFCFTFEPMKASLSPLPKLTPMSSRKGLGQRYMSGIHAVFHQQMGDFLLAAFRRLL
jgi:hypothetical protein